MLLLGRTPDKNIFRHLNLYRADHFFFFFLRPSVIYDLCAVSTGWSRSEPLRKKIGDSFLFGSAIISVCLRVCGFIWFCSVYKKTWPRYYYNNTIRKLLLFSNTYLEIVVSGIIERMALRTYALSTASECFKNNSYARCI